MKSERSSILVSVVINTPVAFKYRSCAHNITLPTLRTAVSDVTVEALTYSSGSPLLTPLPMAAGDSFLEFRMLFILDAG